MDISICCEECRDWAYSEYQAQDSSEVHAPVNYINLQLHL